MAPICRAVRKSTQANVVGLCHGVGNVASHLADLLDVDLDRLDYTAVGVNHLTWFTELRVSGEDQMPRLLALDDVPDHPFTWQLLRLFHAYPACRDRHVCEFFPWMFKEEHGHYGKTLGVDRFSFEDTIAEGDAVFNEMKEYALSTDPLPSDFFERISGEHEQVLDIIESIRTDARRLYSANLPNTTQAPNLPADAIIEAPAVAGSDGLTPVPQPPMPPGLAATLATRLQWVEVIVDAALEGSREKFVQALLIDGAVDSIGTARSLAADLIEVQSEYLPRFGSRPVKD
jgi:alpha-galactosidase